MAITEIQKGQTNWHLQINENFKALEDMIKDVALAMYPVGSIYMSTASTNPGTLFGGTWVGWGSGRVPVGVNTTDNDFKAAEQTGGAKTHTLTVDQVPAHKHTVASSVGWGDGGNSGYGSGYGRTDSNNPAHRWVEQTSSNAGGGQAHNNLQPYITCYMWKRIA